MLGEHGCGDQGTRDPIGVWTPWLRINVRNRISRGTQTQDIAQSVDCAILLTDVTVDHFEHCTVIAR
jgi:hypothetical protein